MNDLQEFLKVTAGDEVHYMNLLQGSSNCPVSDLCVNASDVCPDDAARAVNRIMGRPLDKVKQWISGGF